MEDSLILADWCSNLERSVLRQMISVVSKPGILSFAGGLPSPELFPVKDFSESVQYVLDNDSYSLQYQPPFEPLKDHIVKLMKKRGITCSSNEIFLTTGAQQGLDILARLLLNPRGNIILEESIYTGIQQVINPLQATVYSVSTDLDSGIDVNQVEKLLKDGIRPPFFYVVPNAQNPLGVSISYEKREKLVKLAKEYNVPIIEDDPYGFLCYEDKSDICLKSLEPNWVFYLGSFSKVLAPGLRLGWMIVPSTLIPTLTVIKEAYDLESSSLIQRSISTYLDKNVFENHLKNLCKVYGERRNLMLNALEKYFPKSAKWTKPTAGMFIWVVLQKPINTADLLTFVLETEKVAFIPGYAFSVGNSDATNCIRLNFSNTQTDKITDGVKRLGNAIKKYINEK